MYGFSEAPEPCGHHCPSDCPKCGEDRPKRPRKSKSKSKKKWCGCEGAHHEHGCHNGG